MAHQEVEWMGVVAMEGEEKVVVGSAAEEMEGEEMEVAMEGVGWEEVVTGVVAREGEEMAVERVATLEVATGEATEEATEVPREA